LPRKLKYSELPPEIKERLREEAREYYHKMKNDPEYQKKHRAWYHKKNAASPGFYRGKYQKNPEHYRQYARAVRAKNRVIGGKPGSVRYEAKLAGYRSGFERTVAMNMESRGIKFEYESVKLPYTLEGIYNPDIRLVDSGIIIEIKGVLSVEDRRKMRAVKAQHPDLDIRFCFMNAKTKIQHGKQSNADWAEKNGFLWCEGKIPEEWLTE
jgi:hypothetical protein